MKLSRTYKRDKYTGKLVETTPQNVKAILAEMPKRRRSKPQPGITPICHARQIWPRLSDSMSVRPKARKQVMAMLEAAGIPTHIAPDGRFEMRSQKHQNAVSKFYNYRHNNAGYGDYAGR